MSDPIKPIKQDHLRCRKLSIVVKYYNRRRYFLVYHLVQVGQRAEGCTTMACDCIAGKGKTQSDNIYFTKERTMK